jgi:hypothetical protein
MACSMRSTRRYGIFVCSARILAIVDFPVAGRPPITTSTGRTERCSHFRLRAWRSLGVVGPPSLSSRATETCLGVAEHNSVQHLHNEVGRRTRGPLASPLH